VALISEDLEDGARKGIEAVDFLHESHPQIRAVLLVRRIRRELTLDAFCAGANGIFCRVDPIEPLTKCIAAVHKGQVWADSEQMPVILQALVEVNPRRITSLSGTPLLTKREREVAVLVAHGLRRRYTWNLGLTSSLPIGKAFSIWCVQGENHDVPAGFLRRLQPLRYRTVRRKCNGIDRWTA
jgi:hypothetical protein